MAKDVCPLLKLYDFKDTGKPLMGYFLRSFMYGLGRHVPARIGRTLKLRLRLNIKVYVIKVKKCYIIKFISGNLHRCEDNLKRLKKSRLSSQVDISGAPPSTKFYVAHTCTLFVFFSSVVPLLLQSVLQRRKKLYNIESTPSPSEQLRSRTLSDAVLTSAATVGSPTANDARPEALTGRRGPEAVAIWTGRKLARPGHVAAIAGRGPRMCGNLQLMDGTECGRQAGADRGRR